MLGRDKLRQVCPAGQRYQGVVALCDWLQSGLRGERVGNSGQSTG